MRLLQQAPSAAAMLHIEALGRRLGIMLQSCAVAMLLKAVGARLLPLEFQPHLPTDAATAGGGVCCCSICQPQLKKLQAPQPAGSTNVAFAITALCCRAGTRAAGRGAALHRALGRQGVGRRAADEAPHRRAARRLRRPGPQVVAVSNLLCIPQSRFPLAPCLMVVLARAGANLVT